MTEAHNYAVAGPEIFLACTAMALLMLGVFRGNEGTRLISWLAVVALALAFAWVAILPGGRTVTFAGDFVVDGFARFSKLLVLLGAGLGIVMSLDFIEREGMARFEYPVLLLLATLGMLMMVSANDLIALYLGVEVQSLALYVVATIQRGSERSSEAGLKYFVLGALSSGMLLYGASMIYGFTGHTGFDAIARAVAVEGGTSIGLIIGIAFLTAGLAFKVSAVPFHMWTPDVYEGAPTPVTAFLSVAPKIAAIALFIRAMLAPFPALTADWQQIIIFISIASMVLGAFAAIGQRNIKRLMAYSSIGHMGYALIGLASGSVEGVRATLIYMAIYLVMNVGTFACILCMRRPEGMVEGIADLAGLDRSNRPLALVLLIFMFSMAGVPPAAGFFAKFYIFLAALHAGLYWLAVIGVLASVVGAVYYLRIVKVMYFDEPAEPFVGPIGIELRAILAVASVFIVFFALLPGPVIDSAQAAATALLP